MPIQLRHQTSKDQAPSQLAFGVGVSTPNELAGAAQGLSAASQLAGNISAKIKAKDEATQDNGFELALTRAQLQQAEQSRDLHTQSLQKDSGGYVTNSGVFNDRWVKYGDGPNEFINEADGETLVREDRWEEFNLKVQASASGYADSHNANYVQSQHLKAVLNSYGDQGKYVDNLGVGGAAIAFPADEVSRLLVWQATSAESPLERAETSVAQQEKYKAQRSEHMVEAVDKFIQSHRGNSVSIQYSLDQFTALRQQVAEHSKYIDHPASESILLKLDSRIGQYQKALKGESDEVSKEVLEAIKNKFSTMEERELQNVTGEFDVKLWASLMGDVNNYNEMFGSTKETRKIEVMTNIWASVRDPKNMEKLFAKYAESGNWEQANVVAIDTITDEGDQAKARRYVTRVLGAVAEAHDEGRYAEAGMLDPVMGSELRRNDQIVKASLAAGKIAGDIEANDYTSSVHIMTAGGIQVHFDSEEAKTHTVKTLAHLGTVVDFYNTAPTVERLTLAMAQLDAINGDITVTDWANSLSTELSPRFKKFASEVKLFRALAADPAMRTKILSAYLDPNLGKRLSQSQDKNISGMGRVIAGDAEPDQTPNGAYYAPEDMAQMADESGDPATANMYRKISDVLQIISDPTVSAVENIAIINDIMKSFGTTLRTGEGQEPIYVPAEIIGNKRFNESLYNRSLHIAWHRDTPSHQQTGETMLFLGYEKVEEKYGFDMLDINTFKENDFQSVPSKLINRVKKKVFGIPYGTFKRYVRYAIAEGRSVTRLGMPSNINGTFQTPLEYARYSRHGVFLGYHQVLDYDNKPVTVATKPLFEEAYTQRGRSKYNKDHREHRFGDLLKNETRHDARIREAGERAKRRSRKRERVEKKELDEFEKDAEKAKLLSRKM